MCFGTLPNQCLSCISPSLLLISQNICINSCPLGTFKFNLTCNLCTGNCEECSNSFECTRCDKTSANPYLFNNTCIFNCPSNTFTINNVCLSCYSTC